MPPEFEIFNLLRRHGVPFVIVGGHAVNFHGYRRTTEDADVIWLRSPEAEVSLYRALSEVNACYIGRDIDPSTGIERTYPITPLYIQVTHLMMLWTGSSFLDLFDYVPGFPQGDVEELFKTSVESEGLRFASIDWLRRMKSAASRTKDILDLENLPPGD